MFSINAFIQHLREVLRQGAVRAQAAVSTASSLVAGAFVSTGVKFKNTYKIECFDKFGNWKWTEEIPNQVMAVGTTDLLGKYFEGSAYTAAFYVGLVDNTSFSAFAAADTMASHAGWLESAAYSNATRPAWTGGGVTVVSGSQSSVDNSASKAQFNINAIATINGAFLATNSTKSGTTGTIFGAASFASTRSVLSGDTLNVTVTLTAQ